MNNNVEIHFKNIVERIFSNWTGIQMAVEHGMAGPMGKQLVLQAIDYVCNYCLTTNNLEASELRDALEDILEEEFNTVCEDNSPNDVANELCKFIQILRQGNMDMFITESNKLPPLRNWLQLNEPVQRVAESSEDEELEDEADESMDVDPGWTVVKGRKKK